ncbi:MAG TPA: hypothetical protein VII06_32040 [Chloroflexota bacterium]|jgi:hypothetical protein
MTVTVGVRCQARPDAQAYLASPDYRLRPRLSEVEAMVEWLVDLPRSREPRSRRQPAESAG